MDMQIQQCGAVSVVKPQGPLTREDIEDFQEHVFNLIKEHLGRVVLDVSAIAYVDSVGLETLLDIADELSAGGHCLKLCAANDTLLQVIALTGLSDHFEQFEDSHAAVRSFL
jgi:anti-sigma B factor antagonist